MLDNRSKPHLFRALDANRCVLFLGAGFSRGGRNRLGRPLPLGKELAPELWKHARLEGDYDGASLADVYQSALASGRPLSELSHLLESHLLCVEVDAWYATVAKAFWYRIYTTNADDLLERVFREFPASMTLETIAAPRDEFRERDQFLRRVQYVKLHGSLPGDPRTLTFGTLQYAGRANAQDDWWRHFVRDYVFHPTLFVGSEVDEPLFWQAIAAREARYGNPEERPQSYLVTPRVSPAKRRVLEDFNIAHIPATAEDFFGWLASEYSFPTREAVLAQLDPESAEVLARAGVNTRTRDALAAFMGTFRPVPQPSRREGGPKVFFRGAPPTWEDIASDYDAPREINTEILTAVREAFECRDGATLIAVLGEGGSGKTTALRRVGFSLRAEGYEVYFSDGGERPDVRMVLDALRTIGRKTCLIIDNGALLGPVLADLVRGLRDLDEPPVVLVGSRYIPFEHKLRDSLGDEHFIELEMPLLTDADVGALLWTLEQHQQLGHLAELTPDDRAYELKQRARKQILVAMREATEGRGFDEILESEFAELSEREHRILFLCAALGTAELIDLSEKQWFDCAAVPPSDALRILRRDLRGVLDVDARTRTVAARHPVIAEYILDRVAERVDVAEAYRRTLLAISRDIYSGVGRRTRIWRLFTRLINHQSVYERFGSDLDCAREVYDSTASAFGNDGHFWLQYASLEIDFGLAEYARPHLANAEGLLGDTDLVMITKAHMMLREALFVSRYDEAYALRRDAEDILEHQMERAARDDEYPFHVYLTHVLAWIRHWVFDSETRKRELEGLQQRAREASLRMPANRKLKGILEVITREYLGLAVR